MTLSIQTFIIIDDTAIFRGVARRKYHVPTIIPHSQYHGRWWPADARSRAISSDDIEIFLTVFPSVGTRTEGLNIFVNCLKLLTPNVYVSSFLFVQVTTPLKCVDIYSSVMQIFWCLPGDISLCMFRVVKNWDCLLYCGGTSYFFAAIEHIFCPVRVRLLLVESATGIAVH